MTTLSLEHKNWSLSNNRLNVKITDSDVVKIDVRTNLTKKQYQYKFPNKIVPVHLETWRVLSDLEKKRGVDINTVLIMSSGKLDKRPTRMVTMKKTHGPSLNNIKVETTRLFSRDAIRNMLAQ